MRSVDDRRNATHRSPIAACDECGDPAVVPIKETVGLKEFRDATGKRRYETWILPVEDLRNPLEQVPIRFVETS